MRTNFLLLVLISSTPSLTLGQNTLVIDSAADYLELYKFMEFTSTKPEVLNPLSLPGSPIWKPAPTTSHSQSSDSVWWYRGVVELTVPDSLDFILKGAGISFVDIFLLNAAGEVTKHLKTGLYRSAAEKALNRTTYSAVPVRFGPGKNHIFIRAEVIDHQDFSTYWNLESPASWYSRPAHRLDPQIQFFQGVFWILIIYNLVLFFSLRIPAYLYYAGYLFCVSTFVMFAVGDMTHPEFGNPRYIAPLGYLFFGSINIFYYLFGQNFLNLQELLPKWNRFIHYYIRAKIAVLILVQLNLYTWFHIPIALVVEFSMVMIDVIISLIFFVSLLKTKTRLAYFFVAGSASVVVFGITSAILGYLFNLQFTFTIFLSSIVVEVVFFSLGLGYKIRLSEKQKLQAEREKRTAQEALNEELTRINTAFGRFVPQDFLKSLGHESILDVNLGDSVQKEVTVMFSDIRGYTSLSEKMTPQENFKFLNAYLGRMGPIIHQHRGFVNQYYGDGIMALFLSEPSDAVAAAIAMQEELQAYNKVRIKAGRKPVQIGIGIHTGPLMMGVIGDTLRLEAGVVSDTVNIAARVEGLTKYYGAPILASNSTFSMMDQEKILSRYLGNVKVKGKELILGIHEVIDGLPTELKQQKARTKREFDHAINTYLEGDFATSTALFEQITSNFPEDQAARIFYTNSLTYLQLGPPEGWDGADRITEK